MPRGMGGGALRWTGGGGAGGGREGICAGRLGRPMPEGGCGSDIVRCGGAGKAPGGRGGGAGSALLARDGGAGRGPGPRIGGGAGAAGVGIAVDAGIGSRPPCCPPGKGVLAEPAPYERCRAYCFIDSLMRYPTLHSSSRAICSNVSHRTSRHSNERVLFLFGSGDVKPASLGAPGAWPGAHARSGKITLLSISSGIQSRGPGLREAVSSSSKGRRSTSRNRPRSLLLCPRSPGSRALSECHTSNRMCLRARTSAPESRRPRAP